MSEDENKLTEAQGRLLVRLARKTLEKKLGREPRETDNDLNDSTAADPDLQRRLGVFVTLKKVGALRGCIGSLTGSSPLLDGVRSNAVNAAFNDPRFPPLTKKELDQIHIEVSVLTEPEPLDYADSSELLSRLRPSVDGVILRWSGASATYLPQVWDQLPDPAAFLTSLCLKAGLPGDTWRRKAVTIETYQVQAFEE